MMKRSLAAALAALCLVAQAAHADDRVDGQSVQLARYPIVLVGPGNVTVEVAGYKTKDGAEGAILSFKGVESDWDGKAIAHHVRPGMLNRKEYVTKTKGKDFITLVMQPGETGKQYWLTLPEDAQQIAVVPSDGAAQATSTRAIFDDYQKQSKSK
jgi:hypothetical protein